MLVAAKSTTASAGAKRMRGQSASTPQAAPPLPPPQQQPFSPGQEEEQAYLEDDEFLCQSPELLMLHCYQQNPQQQTAADATSSTATTTDAAHQEEDQHAITLRRELGEQQQRGEFCDLTLMTETSTIPVHVCVVAACSPVVRNYLRQSPVRHLRLSSLPGLTEIQKRALNDDFAVRNLLCEFAYSGQFSAQVRSSASAVCMLDEDDGVGAMERTVRLLAGSLGLGISAAVHAATCILKSRIDVANGLLIYSAAWDLGCTELERVAEAFVDVNFSLVCLEQSWIDASDSLLSRILCRDELQTSRGEMEVFRSISRWAQEDFARRSLMVEAMLTNPRIFRIQYLSDAQLRDLHGDRLVMLQQFAGSVKRLVEFEEERRRCGLPPETSVPCRFYEPAPESPPAMLFSMEFEGGGSSPRPTTSHHHHHHHMSAGTPGAFSSSMPALPASAAAAPPPPPAPAPPPAAAVSVVAPYTATTNTLFRSVRVLPGHEKAVCSLATTDRWVVSGSQDHTIRVWDLETNSTRAVLRGHVDSVSVLRFFPATRQLVSGSFDRSLRVWDDFDNNGQWKQRGFVAEVAHDDPITCLMVISRTNQLASGTSGGEIKIWSPLVNNDNANANASASCQWMLFFMVQNAHAHVLWSCCEWGDTVVTGSSDTEIRVWDSTTWELRQRLHFHKDEVQALLVIGSELYSGSDDGVVNVYRPGATQPARSTALGRAIMAFSELDGQLVVGLGDGGILVLNAADLALVAELKSHASSVMALAVVMKRHLVSGSFDKSVRLWERELGGTMAIHPPPLQQQQSAA